MGEPTGRQLEVLRLFYDRWEMCEPLPTVRELCEAMGIGSTNGVTDHLRLLAKKGLVERSRINPRRWKPTEAGLQAAESARRRR